jgi:hypothetical protein
MRLFDLLSFQHIVLYLFPALIFLVILGLSLGYSHFHGPDSQVRQTKIIYRFPEGIEERNAPFPLALTLIIIGTVLWMFFYILGSGLLKVLI